MIDLLHDKYIIDYASKFKYSLFISCNESRLETETYSVAFGIFRECGTVFYRVRYGAVRCIHLVIPFFVIVYTSAGIWAASSEFVSSSIPGHEKF